MGAVILRFHPNQRNPARKSGYGVYRVAGWLPRALHDVYVEAMGPVYRENALIVRTDRVYKKGSRVDPLKILLASRRVEAGRLRRWHQRQLDNGVPPEVLAIFRALSGVN
jgi:hypothetical protein